MAKRGLGKTSGRPGSRPDTLDAALEAEARTGPISRVVATPPPPPGAAGTTLHPQELQDLLTQPHESHAPVADEARLLTDFFSVPPPAPERSDVELEELVHASKAPRAMWTTVGMLAVSVVAIGSFLAYQEMFVPQPVELGSDEPVLVLEGPAGMDLPAEHRPGDAPEAVSGEPANTEVSRSAATDDTLALAIEGTDKPARDPGAIAQVDRASPPSAANAQPLAEESLLGGVGQLGASASPVQPGETEVAPLGASAAEIKPREPEAIVPLTAATSVAASVATVDARLSFEELLEDAESFSRRGQSVQAVAAFERALQRQPGAPAALAGKAYAYLNLNDQHSAKALAEQALAADPTSSRGWIVLGAAEELLGSRSAAQSAYRQCAERGVGHYVDECRKLVR